MSITLPNVPGIVFAYDARQGVTLEPVEATGTGLFEFAVGSVQGIKGPPLTRRVGGAPPNNAMQIPFAPNSGFNGHVAPAYAPCFDILAGQQSCLQTEHGIVPMGGFNGSFVVLAAMGAATPNDGRLISYYGDMDPSGTDQGNYSLAIFYRDLLTNTVKTDRAGTSIVTPIELDRLYRFGLVLTDAAMTHYLDNVETTTGPAFTGYPMHPMCRIALGGQGNSFGEFVPLTWDGPIVFAMGANVAWNASERAAVDSWIVSQFNLN